VSLMIMSGELVELVGDSIKGHPLDTYACAILSRMLLAPRRRGILIPDLNWPPYTHVLVMQAATFRVTVTELTPDEVEAVGLGRSVSVEEAELVIRRPLCPVPAGVGMTPGEVIQDAISRGMPGWRWVP
jgi:hypothetical protein